MGGGAWPFLVGGSICLVNSDNERDSFLLNRCPVLLISSLCAGRCGFGRAARSLGSPGTSFFLEGQAASSRMKKSNNRSVMPLDVLGRTRATLKESACNTSLSERNG